MSLYKRNYNKHIVPDPVNFIYFYLDGNLKPPCPLSAAHVFHLVLIKVAKAWSKMSTIANHLI